MPPDFKDQVCFITGEASLVMYLHRLAVLGRASSSMLFGPEHARSLGPSIWHDVLAASIVHVKFGTTRGLAGGVAYSDSLSTNRDMQA